MMSKLAHTVGEASGEATSSVGGHSMMGGFGGMGSGWLWLGGIAWIATWVLVLAVLAALFRWLWKKGGK